MCCVSLALQIPVLSPFLIEFGPAKGLHKNFVFEEIISDQRSISLVAQSWSFGPGYDGKLHPASLAELWDIGATPLVAVANRSSLSQRDST